MKLLGAIVLVLIAVALFTGGALPAGAGLLIVLALFGLGSLLA